MVWPYEVSEGFVHSSMTKKRDVRGAGNIVLPNAAEFACRKSHAYSIQSTHPDCKKNAARVRWRTGSIVKVAALMIVLILSLLPTVRGR